jgi:hypothetical protein
MSPNEPWVNLFSFVMLDSLFYWWPFVPGNCIQFFVFYLLLHFLSFLFVVFLLYIGLLNRSSGVLFFLSAAHSYFINAISSHSALEILFIIICFLDGPWFYKVLSQCNESLHSYPQASNVINILPKYFANLFHLLSLLVINIFNIAFEFEIQLCYFDVHVL